MTVRELYERIGGDYDAAVGRLRLDALVSRFIIMFLDDPSCDAFIEAWESGDEEAIFKTSHTVKGMCSNISLTSVQEPASQICEAFREGNEHLRETFDLDALMDQFKAAYSNAVEEIREFAAEQNG